MSTLPSTLDPKIGMQLIVQEAGLECHYSHHRATVSTITVWRSLPHYYHMFFPQA